MQISNEIITLEDYNTVEANNYNNYIVPIKINLQSIYSQSSKTAELNYFSGFTRVKLISKNFLINNNKIMQVDIDVINDAFTGKYWVKTDENNFTRLIKETACDNHISIDCSSNILYPENSYLIVYLEMKQTNVDYISRFNEISLSNLIGSELPYTEIPYIQGIAIDLDDNVINRNVTILLKDDYNNIIDEHILYNGHEKSHGFKFKFDINNSPIFDKYMYIPQNNKSRLKDDQRVHGSLMKPGIYDYNISIFDQSKELFYFNPISVNIGKVYPSLQYVCDPLIYKRDETFRLRIIFPNPKDYFVTNDKINFVIEYNFDEYSFIDKEFNESTRDIVSSSTVSNYNNMTDQYSFDIDIHPYNYPAYQSYSDKNSDTLRFNYRILETDFTHEIDSYIDLPFTFFKPNSWEDIINEVEDPCGTEHIVLKNGYTYTGNGKITLTKNLTITSDKSPNEKIDDSDKDGTSAYISGINDGFLVKDGGFLTLSFIHFQNCTNLIQQSNGGGIFLFNDDFKNCRVVLKQDKALTGNSTDIRSCFFVNNYGCPLILNSDTSIEGNYLKITDSNFYKVGEVSLFTIRNGDILLKRNTFIINQPTISENESIIEQGASNINNYSYSKAIFSIDENTSTINNSYIGDPVQHPPNIFNSEYSNISKLISMYYYIYNEKCHYLITSNINTVTSGISYITNKGIFNYNLTQCLSNKSIGGKCNPTPIDLDFTVPDNLYLLLQTTDIEPMCIFKHPGIIWDGDVV
jgi:hypothetical protein